MEKSIHQRIPMKSLMKRNLLCFTLLLLLPMASLAYGDKIWLKSRLSVKTVYDVKVFSLLRNLYENRTVINPENELWQRAHLLSERDAMLEQLVVNRYVDDNRLDLEIPAFQIINGIKKINLVFGSENERKQTLATWGIKEKEIESWVVARLTLEKFLMTHAPFQAIVTDRKITQYYETNKQNKFLDQPLEQIKDLVIEDYKRDVLRVEFNKWMDQEMRRQKWTIQGG